MCTINQYQEWKRIFEILRNLHDEVLVRDVKHLEKKYIQRAHLVNHIIFMSKCRKHDIIPRGCHLDCIQTRFGKSKRFQKLQLETERKVVRELIIKHYKSIHEVNQSIYAISQRVSRECDDDLWKHIQASLQKSFDRERVKISETQKKKFDCLLKDQVEIISSTITSDGQLEGNSKIVNLSDHTLSEEEEKLLSLGLNYALPYPDQADQMLKTMFAVEGKLNRMDLNESDKLAIRKGVTRIVDAEVKPNNIRVKWQRCISLAIRSLKSNTSIKIGKSDKGNAVVLLNSNDYNTKMQDLILSGPYVEIDHDPTAEYKSLVQNSIENLKKDGKLTDEQCASIIPKDCGCPKMYGAPKIHKPNVPVRPVVDYRPCPTYLLARFLALLLSVFMKNGKYTLQTSYDFVDKLKHVNIKESECQVSFDVKSLFTSVPIEKGLSIVRKRLQEDLSWKRDTFLEVEDVIGLLRICLSCTYFKFGDSFYRQVDGSPMGSPVSPVFAEIVMQYLEDRIITPCIQSNIISHYSRYVDDSYAIMTECRLPEVLERLNSNDVSLEFTHELEVDGKLPFLDLMIYRKDNGSLGYYIYRKPTFTNNYLMFSSFHPQAHKIGVVDTLLSRAIRLCDDDHVECELANVRHMLNERGYPRSMIDRRLRIVKNKELARYRMPVLAEKGKVANKYEHRFILPWSGDVTRKIARYLRSKLDVEIGYYPGIKIGSILCNLKDKNKGPRAGVYLLGCSGPTCDAKYVGETKRDWPLRIREHENDVRKRNCQNAVALHMIENDGHAIDQESCQLLEPETRTFKRLIKESLYIRCLPNKMNSYLGTNINQIWCSTLLPLYKSKLDWKLRSQHQPITTSHNNN